MNLRELLTDQRSRYLIVGGVNTVFGFALFTGVFLLFENKFNYLTIFVFCQVVAVLFSHSMQRRFVWRTEVGYLVELFKFSASYFFISVINILLLAVAKERLNFPVLYSQYTIGFSLILAMYFIQKTWVFKADN